MLALFKGDCINFTDAVENSIIPTAAIEAGTMVPILDSTVSTPSVTITSSMTSLLPTSASDTGMYSLRIKNWSIRIHN